MKKRLRLQIAFWLAFAFILSCGFVTAQLGIPHHFYGIVTVGGLPALDGTVVTATIDGVSVENTETFDGGKYVFKVPGESGDTIAFFVDELQVENYVFQEGGSTGLNLPAPAPEFVVSNLAIDPTEVSPGEVLTITADVTNAGEVRFTHTVTLRIDNVEEGTEEVVLLAGASTAVSFTVTRDTPGTYSVDLDGLTGTFKVLKPAAFELTNLSIAPASVEAGESVSITVDVKNIGELEGTYSLTLRIDGAVEATKDVKLAGGVTASVTFRISKNFAGTYGVEVDGLSGSFQVTEPTAPPTPPTPPPEEFAEFTVTSLTIIPSDVLVGNQAAIIVDVKNVGNIEGTYTLTLRVNDVPAQTRDVTLAGGASGTVTFIVAENVEGTYNIEVDGLTGSFTVVAPPLPPSTIVEIPRITLEAPASVEVENTAITVLEISVLHTVENVRIIIQELVDRPAEIAITAPGVIYRYLEIIKESITDNDISSVTITFKVEKTWITAQGIDENTITLNRYDAETGEWVPLPTVKVGEDAIFVYFSATSEKLSYFAVAGWAKAPAPAAFVVSSLAISPSEVVVGKEISISVTVQNTGGLEGTYTVTLRINGVIEDIENVTLAGGTTESVTFSVVEDAEGTYNVEVDGLTEAFVVTEPAPSPGPTPPPTTGPVMGLWMTGGIIAAAVIISVAVFYVKRRR